MALFKCCVNDPTVPRLLALCMYQPTPNKLMAVIARYASMTGWAMYGLHLDGILVGLIGARLSVPGHAVIQHIAVVPEEQRQGIGRQLIQRLIAAHQLRRCEAETDGDAVEFYQRCGFRVHSLGEVYAGVERFRCVLNVPATDAL